MYVNIFTYKKQLSIRAETVKTLSVLLGGWKGPSNLFDSNSFQNYYKMPFYNSKFLSAYVQPQQDQK